ncbi:MAG: ribonuclease P protein component [Mariprofundaceae bacterium]|nr:ribonuclease P protein component [Mariprofundaceae bacterium]
MNQKFSSNFRLRSRQDFAGMKEGRRFQWHGLRCIVVNNHLEHGRIGFAVSRKYGNSVQRHHLKRVFREVFRSHPIKFEALDILMIPSRSFDSKANIYQDATDILNRLLCRYQA